jgi:vacuolar-type H+-ATPase subunit E/Vma4
MNAQETCARMEIIMTLEDKLELFYKSAVEDAKAQSDALINEYEASLEKEFSVRRADVKRQARNSYRIEKEELLRDKNKKLSQAAKDVKRQVLEEEKSYAEILFSLVETKIREYMKTEAYENKLAEQILQAKEIADGAELVLYINASDEEKKSSLEEKTGTSISISTIEFIGGMRAVIRSNNILIDNSFFTKLAEEKETYKMV